MTSICRSAGRRVQPVGVGARHGIESSETLLVSAGLSFFQPPVPALAEVAMDVLLRDAKIALMSPQRIVAMSKPRKNPGRAGAGSAPSRRMDYRLRLVLSTGPLYAGESHEAYRDLLERIREALSVEDFIDELLAKDVADISWEILRLRRLKADYLFAPITQKKFELLKKLGHSDEKVVELLRQGSDGDLDFTLSMAGRPRVSMEAETVVDKAYGLSQFDSMIATCERRRDALLGEFERRHDSRARRSKDQVIDIAKGDYEVTEKAPRLSN